MNLRDILIRNLDVARLAVDAAVFRENTKMSAKNPR